MNSSSEEVKEYSNLMSYLRKLAKDDKQEIERIQRFKPLIERSILRSMSKVSLIKNQDNNCIKITETEKIHKIPKSENKIEKKQVKISIPMTRCESEKKVTNPNKSVKSPLDIRPSTCKNLTQNYTNILKKEIDFIAPLPAHTVCDLFQKCNKNESQAKKLNRAITKIHHTKNKSFKNKLEKKIREMNSTGCDDVKKVLSGNSNFKKDRNYLIFRDYQNKPKIVSHNKNNIYEKLNFVKQITPTTAFEMKHQLNNLFLVDSNKLKNYDLSRPKTSHERPIKRDINFGEINKNHSLIKQIISNTKEVKNRIYKLENIVG